MTHMVFKLTAISLSGLALSGCTIPGFDISDTVQAPALTAPAVQAPAVTAPTAQAPAVAAPTAQAPAVQAPAKPRWGHQRIGNTPNTSDGDEDGGWG